MSPKKFQENESDYLYFKINNSNVRRFFSLYNSIKRNVDNKRKVNPKEFNELFEILNPKNNDKSEYYEALVKSIYEEVLHYFTLPNKKYSFKFSKKDILYDVPLTGKKRHLPKMDYTFSKMLKEVVYESVSLFESNTIKYDFLTYTYKNITDYLNQLSEMKEKFTHYKISIIVGYIAFKLDYSLSKTLTEHKNEGTLPTTNEIFNAVQYTLNPSK